MPFSPTQIAQLAAELDNNLITRRADNSQIYIEGYVAIDQANDIFGYHGWGSEMIGLPWSVKTGTGNIIYFAAVKVTALTPDGEKVEHSGMGACAVAAGVDKDKPDHHDTAIKGAETDAMKRALRHFGNQFGNSLYDKEDPVNTALKQGASSQMVERAKRTRTEAKDATGEDLPVRPCETCTKPIEPYTHTNKQGMAVQITVRKQLDLGQRFNKALCRDCLATAYEQAKAA